MGSLPALASSPAVAAPLRRRRRRLLNAARASSSSRAQDSSGSTRYQAQPQPQPRLVAAQAPPPLAAGVVQRDAETGLAFLLFVLSVVDSTSKFVNILVRERLEARTAKGLDSWMVNPNAPQDGSFEPDIEECVQILRNFKITVVMSSFLSLAIFSFPVCRALQQLETAAHKLSKVVAEEVPGTLSSLKLSLLEINDLSSQLNNLRQKLTINRFGKNDSAEARSQTGWPKQTDV